MKKKHVDRISYILIMSFKRVGSLLLVTSQFVLNSCSWAAEIRRINNIYIKKAIICNNKARIIIKLRG